MGLGAPARPTRTLPGRPWFTIQPENIRWSFPVPLRDGQSCRHPIHFIGQTLVE